MNITRSTLFLLALTARCACASAEQTMLPASVHFMAGPVNGVAIHRNERSLVVYGDPHRRFEGADWVLLTHARRDAVWAAYAVVAQGAKVIAPAKEAAWLNDPQAFWDAQVRDQYHDYAQQSTRIPTAALPVAREVADG